MSQKIVIIGPAYPLRGGGLASFNERLARQFQAEGHQVTIYTFSLQYPSFLFPGSSQWSTEAPPMDLDIKVRINSINPFNWWSVGNELKRLQPDRIIIRYWLPFMGPCFGTILRFVKQNKHTRILCLADNVVPHEKRIGDRFFTRYFMKPVDAFIVMSETVLSDLRTFEPHKPAILVPHPLYDNFGDKLNKATARNLLKIDANTKLLLFFGFIRHYKGLDMLLEAMKILKEGSKDYRLLIAGEFYEDRKGYEEQIERLGIQDSLILRTDFIPDNEVRNYLSAADVVVQPYRHATQSGVTPLAYHFEIPMVVTNVGGLPDLVPDGKVGLVAEPNPAAIADQIIRFFEIGESHFLPHLIEEKKKYTWAKLTEKFLTL